jgi:hypothetical protein
MPDACHARRMLCTGLPPVLVAPQARPTVLWMTSRYSLAPPAARQRWSRAQRWPEWSRVKRWPERAGSRERSQPGRSGGRGLPKLGAHAPQAGRHAAGEACAGAAREACMRSLHAKLRDVNMR